jgi:hypothetical protein
MSSLGRVPRSSSLLIQGYALVRLRAVISLKGSLPYIAGGSAGVILATLALGLFLFGRASDGGFGRAVSVLLLCSGIALLAYERM